MKVVVGANEEGHRTPLFSDEIEYATFRPFWNIPTSIAVNELIPDGPETLVQNGYELVRSFSPDAEVHPMTAENLQRVVDGHLLMRQAAGPSNALGPGEVHVPPTATTSTSTTRPPGATSPATSARSATAACAWRTPSPSASGCSGRKAGPTTACSTP